MTSKISTLIALFLITSSSASAYFATSEQSCAPFDLRETFPLKMRTQGDIAWCYAFSAADYLQTTYQIPEQISAADIAINYTQSDISRFIYFFQRIFAGAGTEPAQTGFVSEAVKRIIPQGYCPESVLPSENWTIIDSNTQGRTSIALLDALDNILALQTKVAAGSISTVDKLPWYPGLQNLNPDTFFNILQTSKRRDLLENLRNTVCSGSRRPYPNSPIATDFNLKGKHVFEKMNASFDQKMPVIIDFFAGILSDYDHFKKPLGDLHTVLIEGRKFDTDTQQCSYLMKNSWGEDCTQYDPKIKCEKGYLWFPENKLYDAMISRFIIKRL